MKKQSIIAWVKLSDVGKILNKFLNIFFLIIKRFTLIDYLNETLQKIVFMTYNCEELKVLDNHFEHE